MLKSIAKPLLTGLLAGSAMEGGTQIVKAISGKKGSRLYLHVKKGGKLYDISSIIAGDENKIRSGRGLLSLLGIKTPLSKIPIIGSILG